MTIGTALAEVTDNSRRQGTMFSFRRIPERHRDDRHDGEKPDFEGGRLWHTNKQMIVGSFPCSFLKRVGTV